MVAIDLLLPKGKSIAAQSRGGIQPGLNDWRIQHRLRDASSGVSGESPGGIPGYFASLFAGPVSSFVHLRDFSFSMPLLLT